jgi:hypothetical protein
MLHGASFEEATGPLVGFDGAQQVGTWTITEVVTPIPAALPLFATGLGGLALWCRKRKAQAVAGTENSAPSRWAESTPILIGTELDKRSGVPVALIARQGDEGLSYAGGAFFALKDAQRGALRHRLAGLTADRSPIPAHLKRDARWVKPELVVGVRHLRGAGALRHATVRELRDD